VVYALFLRISIINVVLASVALSLLFQNLALRFWSEDARAYPAMFSERPILLAGFRFVPQDWATIAAAVLCVLGFQLLFKRTRTGLAMRAVMLDRQTASLMGINVYRTIGNTFGVSAALGAAAGVLVAPSDPDPVQHGVHSNEGLRRRLPGRHLLDSGGDRRRAHHRRDRGPGRCLRLGHVPRAIVYAILIGALLFRPEGLLGCR
jgi:branched-chain amino acid transport system permease protein